MKKYKIILFVFLLPFVGCQDFLDEKPDNMLPQKEAIKSVEDCESFLVGVYSLFKNTAALAVAGTLVPELQADMMALVQGNQQTFASAHNWLFTSQDEDITGLWSAYYGIIFRANLLLSGVEEVKEKVADKLAAAVSPDDKESLRTDLSKLENIREQCCMARALCRVELVKLFADAYDPAKVSTQLALPVWDTPELGTPVRATMKEYYESVLDDLKTASRMTNTKPDDIYFSKGAVKALETRVHVYMHNWKEAIQSASFLIDSSAYELLSAVEVGVTARRGSYGQMWEKDKGNEIIWKIGYNSTDETLGSLGGIFCGLDGAGKFYPDYMPSEKLLNYYNPEDQRFDVFFEERTTNYNHNLVIMAFRKNPGNTDLNYTQGVARYVNMPKVFRLSEIYLLRAEAYYQNGQEGLANKDLHTLKTKRILNYNGLDLSGEALYQEIKNERVRELCLEGHRLYDLKRYGEGFARKSQEGGVQASYSISVQPDNVRFTWPLPKSELDVPNSKMVGNPSNLL